MGGAGEVNHHELPDAWPRIASSSTRSATPAWVGHHRGDAVGAPVVGLATTELASVIHSDGVNGIVDTRPERLIEGMRHLLSHKATARQLGEAGRRTARERFNIDRFAHDWDRLICEVCT
jgi:glycosyltransferase involved in cell wall biosynthesis